MKNYKQIDVNPGLIDQQWRDLKDFLPNPIAACDSIGKADGQWSPVELCLSLVASHIYPHERNQAEASGPAVVKKS